MLEPTSVQAVSQFERIHGRYVHGVLVGGCAFLCTSQLRAALGIVHMHIFMQEFVHVCIKIKAPTAQIGADTLLQSLGGK